MATRKGETIYFFGHGAENPFGFLSNFFPSAFTAPDPAQWLPDRDGSSMPTYSENAPIITFQHSEQYLMYCKALQFEDTKTASSILKEKAPRKCKGLGRRVQGYDEKVWITCREKVMDEGLWWKFGGASESNETSKLGRKLLATGDRELVEASPFDKIWGIGFKATDAESSRRFWGSNLLGKCLMRVRQRLEDAHEGSCSTTEE